MTLLKNPKLYLTLLLGIFIFACTPNSPNAPSSSSTTPSRTTGAVDDEVAVIETDYGKFKVKFYPDVAPKHVANFKKLAREGFYNGLAFHRLIPDGIIQGGDPNTRGDDRTRWGMGEPGQPTVPAEFNQRPFVRGTVGAARKGNDVNSATSQFFICLKPQPQWNGQYTVFGEVVQGINVVQIISNAPRRENSEMAQDKIVMRRVYLEKASAAK